MQLFPNTHLSFPSPSLSSSLFLVLVLFSRVGYELKFLGVFCTGFRVENGGPNPPVVLRDSITCACDFRPLSFLFFSFFVFGYDLIFPEFGLIPNNDFLGMSSC